MLYVAAIESAANFKHARDVGAPGSSPEVPVGQTTMGISCGGEQWLRALLYEAATVRPA
jgi:hypothetical protein